MKSLKILGLSFILIASGVFGYTIIQSSQSELADAAFGTISTIAGTGSAGFSGDGGAATSAQLNYPVDVAVDSTGNVYIADHNQHRVRKVDAGTGNISTVTGTGVGGFSGDGGVATSAQVNFPSGLAIDSNDDVYIADRFNHRIRKIDVSSGLISTVAGSASSGSAGDGGAATSAQLNNPQGVYIDASDNIYIADRNNNKIRLVDNGTGNISTFAGIGSAGFSGDGGLATSAELNSPYDIAEDSAGNIYITDNENRRIRRVDAGTGNISTIIGDGTSSTTGDGGLAVNATVSTLSRVIIDPSDHIYFTDGFGNRVRKIDSGGIVTTAIGTGAASSTGDGGPASSATVWNPWGLDLKGSTLYISETDGHRVRAVQYGIGVQSITPAQNALNVTVSSNVVLTFDGTLNTGTVNQSNLPIFSNGRLIPGAYTFSTTNVSNDTVTFNPTNDFEIGDIVQTSVTSNVQSSNAVSALSFISRSVAEVTAGSGVFNASQNISASSPIVTASGDVDNDGDIDVLSVGGTTLAVALNSGSGSFGTATTTTVLSNARSIALGDYNGDGYLDVAVNYYGAANFSILLNNQSGAFPTKTDYASGGIGIGITTGDFDGDGDLDIAVSNTGSTSVSTFSNNGSGVFSADQTITTSQSSPIHLAVGDMDDDGDLDLFVVDGAPSINVFENDGAGVFTRTNLTLTAGPHDIEALDINGDGDLDLVTSTGLGVISTHIGNGDGTFSARVDLSAGDAEGLAFGDVDNDGDIDFFSVDNTAGELDIILNNGSGVLSVGNTYTIGSNPSGVSAGDYNGDGALDFAATGTNDSQINIFIADSSPAISIIQPNGGETIEPGSTYTIQWSGVDDSGGIASINLEFDDGGGYSAIAGATGLTTHTYNYPFIRSIGSFGTADAQYTIGPYYLAIDSNDNVYTGVQNQGRVYKFDSAGNYLGCIDNTVSGFVASGCTTVSYASLDGQFSAIVGLAVDSNGNIFVGDSLANRVQKFDSDGNFLLKWGSGGSGNSQFNVIQDVDVDSNGNVFVMDRNNRRIQKFDNNGNYLTQWGTDGSGDGQFSILNSYIAVDGTGNVYASGQNRVQKFSNTGTFLGCIDSDVSGFKVSGCSTTAGSNNGQFDYPTGVAVDSSGNIFVVDANNERVQKFDSSGNFVLKWGQNGSGAGQTNFPYGLEVRSNGNVLVADPNNERYSEYKPLGEFTWTVPSSTTETGRIRITASDGVTTSSQDTSDAVFTIGSSGGTIRQRQESTQNGDMINQDDSSDGGASPTEGDDVSKDREDGSSETSKTNPIMIEKIVADSLVRTIESDTVFYIDDQKQKQLFPNHDIYFSWFKNFSFVRYVSMVDLEQYQDKTPVFMRAGTWLVKIQSDPKVYAVEPNGVLRWIPNESTALALYGANWNQQIKDLPDAFFSFYTIGEPVSELANEYATGTIIQVNQEIYYVLGDALVLLTEDEIIRSNLQERFYVQRESIESLLHTVQSVEISSKIDRIRLSI